MAGLGQAGDGIHAGLCLRERDAEQDELCGAEDLAVRYRDTQVGDMLMTLKDEPDIYFRAQA